jgi:hypothetical protein
VRLGSGASSETSVHTRTTRRYIPEDGNINNYQYIETSTRNKCRCSFYCALFALHVSAPIGGHLQVVCNTKNSKAVTVYVNGYVVLVW